MSQWENDRQLCWERVLRTNILFRISHLFAPREFSGGLLALHALFASVDQLCSEVSEELVARKKLEWWRFELLPENRERSRHPVIRHLGETGAADSLPASAVDALLDSVERRLDAYPPSNMKEFKRLCHLIYQPKLTLEHALCGQDNEFPDSQARFASDGGLLQLLRENSARVNDTYWWIPLDSMARHEITRQHLKENGDSDAVRAVLRDVLETGRESAEPQAGGGSTESAMTPGLIHLQLTALLIERQLNHLRERNPSQFPAELNRWHFTDLLAAWNLARKSRKSLAFSRNQSD